MIVEDDKILFRQSWLDSFLRCPHRARLEVTNPEQGTSDSALLGTGAHAGCEAILLGGDTHDAYKNIDRVVEEELKEGVNWTHQSSEFPQNVGQLIYQARKCFDAWLAEIYPVCVSEGWLGETPEQKFEVPLFRLHDGRQVCITGTADLPTGKNVVVDWKTSKRPYKQWEKQRHAIQPTIYTWAAIEGGFGTDHFSWPVQFVYGVMIRPVGNLDGQYRTELVPVSRGEAHARWAMEQIHAALNMALKMGFDEPWPMITDNNFLCSQKWCPNYDRCRGRFLSSTDDQKVEL